MGIVGGIKYTICILIINNDVSRDMWEVYSILLLSIKKRYYKVSFVLLSFNLLQNETVVAIERGVGF